MFQPPPDIAPTVIVSPSAYLWKDRGRVKRRILDAVILQYALTLDNIVVELLLEYLNIKNQVRC